MSSWPITETQCLVVKGSCSHAEVQIKISKLTLTFPKIHILCEVRLSSPAIIYILSIKYNYILPCYFILLFNKQFICNFGRLKVLIKDITHIRKGISRLFPLPLSTQKPKPHMLSVNSSYSTLSLITCGQNSLISYGRVWQMAPLKKFLQSCQISGIQFVPCPRILQDPRIWVHKLKHFLWIITPLPRHDRFTILIFLQWLH